VILDGEHVSPASFCTDRRVISAFTFSKTYAMTGFFPTTCQKAAEAAVDGSREPLQEMVRACRERRELCVGLLEEAGLLISRPRGSFYIMADIIRSGIDARKFAFDLVSTKKVAVAPGTAFGESAQHAVRISLVSSPEDLSMGIGRMIERIEELSE
jgi:aspartate aminotransferase